MEDTLREYAAEFSPRPRRRLVRIARRASGRIRAA
jgi:hypothetical protein